MPIRGIPARAPQELAQDRCLELVMVKHAEAKKGFVLLPHRRVVECSFDWAARFRRLVGDYERMAETLAGLHFVAFVWLMLSRGNIMATEFEHLTNEDLELVDAAAELARSNYDEQFQS